MSSKIDSKWIDCATQRPVLTIYVLDCAGTHWGTNDNGLDAAVNFSSSIDAVLQTPRFPNPGFARCNPHW
jgi:hypothetical protein